MDDAADSATDDAAIAALMRQAGIAGSPGDLRDLLNGINAAPENRDWLLLVAPEAPPEAAARLTGLLDPDAFASAVWADTAYRSAANETAIRQAGRRSMIHFKKPKDRSMPGPHQRANRARSKVRAVVEHVFGQQKARMQLTIRTIGLNRARTKIGLVNLAYNMRRLVWLDAKTAPA